MTTQTKQPSKPAPVITLAPVKSSNIAATGYDAASKTLAVQFKGGNKVYHYADVPESVFGDMGKAESVGKFVGAQIVGKFKHTLQTVKVD
jgi:hypothetical protein